MESLPLIIADARTKKRGENVNGLSVRFAMLCIVDLFGVFPIIALPRPIIDCGWIGLPLAFGVFAMQVYTALLLGRCWVLAENLDPTITNKRRYPYAALAELTMGTTMSKVVTIFLDVTVFGAGIPNLLVASQNMQLLGLKISHNNFDVSFCYWMVLFGLALCPIMWLGSPKDMKWLAVASVSTVCSVGLLTWICMLTDASLPDGFQPKTTSPSWEAIAIAYGILAFQFDIHPMILTVQVDMEKKNDLGKAILGAFMITGSLFAVTTGIGFWKYGAGLRYNLLQGLPASGPLYTDVLLVTMQIALSMVVGASALFQDIEDKLGVPQHFSWRRCLLRSGVMVISVLVGESVPRFDLVMGLIGGSLTGPLMFILPPLFYGRLRERTWRAQVHAEAAAAAAAAAAATSTFKRHDNVDGNGLRIYVGNGSVRRPKTPPLRRRWADALSFDVPADAGPPTFCDAVLTTAIVALGVTATVATTYFSVRDTLRYATFTPPCLVNVTQASRILNAIASSGKTESAS